MKGKIKTIVLVVVFVVVMAGAVVLYNKLSENYMPENTVEAPDSQVQTPDETPYEEEPASELLSAVDFNFTDMNGNAVKLSDFIGKPIVINFWATWCGPCKQEMPHFEKAYKKYGEKIQFLMVNLTDGQDTKEKVEKFIVESGYTFPVYLDTALEGAYTYGAYSIPLSVFINAEGNVVGGQYGTMSESTLESYISQITGDA